MEKVYLKTKSLFCLTGLLCSLNSYAQTVTDPEGNVYPTVTIGNRVWTAANLKVKKYSDGSSITNGIDINNTGWTALGTNGEGGYTHHPFTSVVIDPVLGTNATSSQQVIDTYGLLYNGYVVKNSLGKTLNLPTGWRVSTDADWQELETELGMVSSELNTATWRGATTGVHVGQDLKGTSQLWKSDSKGGTDVVGFNALPAGTRQTSDGAFVYLTERAVFWSPIGTESATQMSRRVLEYNKISIHRSSTLDKKEGMSIRLVREQTAPVNLINYRLKKGANYAVISWETVSEQNNDYFVVERSSDGKNFKELAKIPGKGTTTQKQNYAFTDYFPLSGVNYYRLRQIDKDATVNNYGIIAISFKFDEAIVLSAHPNPVNGSNVTISFAGYQGKAISFSLINTIGITIYNENVNLAEGQADYILNLHKKPAAGQYILNVKGEGLEKSLKLIVK
ncbi:FISUMP domain-containing protein [Pseudopedobacter beijingensis]|uniref:FISUMP domain-containing protein n=1 Tax=Pseudopedobacter beijingensis TaxID=1207056 RepID=A0ABW4ICE5_9SPHI